jgi:tRNA uridine 5-carbamoylmethylation protein Kti12
MSYYIIIRGPLGVGKSTIAQSLAKRLRAQYISIDKVLEEHGLDSRGNRPSIPAENFIKANELVLPQIKAELKKGKRVVIDGCFYHKEQIDHLEWKLPIKHFVFNLKAPLALCIQRDSNREKAYGEGAAKAVYSLVSRFEYGFNIDTAGKTAAMCVKEIVSHLPK